MSGLREEVPLPRRLHRRRPVLVLKMGNGWAVPTQTPISPSGRFPKTSKICPFPAAPSINMDNQDSRGPAGLTVNFQGTSQGGRDFHRLRQLRIFSHVCVCQSRFREDEACSESAGWLNRSCASRSHKPARPARPVPRSPPSFSPPSSDPELLLLLLYLPPRQTLEHLLHLRPG